jgi:carboxyl-terminal processing protease
MVRFRMRPPTLKPWLPVALSLWVALAVGLSSAGQGAAPGTQVAAFDAAWRILRANYIAQTKSAVDWDALRDELRPRAEAAQTPDAVRQIIREMLARIGQSHFAVLPAPMASDLSGPALSPDEVGTLGMIVAPYRDRLIVTRVEPGGPAARNHIKPGWLVNRVDGRDVTGALEQVESHEAHIRHFQQWAIGTAMLRGARGTSANLEFVEMDGQVVERQLTRGPEEGQPVKLGHLPTLFARLESRQVDRGGRSFGVIAFNVWMTAVSAGFDRAVDRFRAADGIVIDLRGNPGGVLTMVMGISGHFLGEPVSLGTIRTAESELKLVANPRRVAPDGRAVEPYTGPLAILVDSGSYSASEIFTSGMQSIDRARVFGTQTAGGALPAVLEQLPGGDVLQYAIGDFVTARGERIEGRGVMPDVEVAPTPASLAEGADPALESAIDWMATQSEG